MSSTDDRDLTGEFSELLSDSCGISPDLQSCHALLAQITAACPDILLIYDSVARRTLYCSGTALELLGYREDRVRPVDLLESDGPIHAGDRAALQSWLTDAAAAAGTISEFDCRMQHADGSWRWMHLRASSPAATCRDDTRLVVTARDVTRDRSFCEALQQSEERQRCSLNASGIGAWELDLRSGAAWRSSSHDRLLGYASPLPDWSIETFFQHIADEERALAQAGMEAAKAHADTWKATHRVRRGDGELRWVEINSRVKRDDAGIALRMHGTTTDVTDQIKLAQTLKQQTDIMSMVMNAMSEGVLVCDAQGVIILANQSARDLLQLPEQLPAVPELNLLYDWLSSDGSRQFTDKERPLARALHGERVSDIEGVIRDHHGKINLHINSSAAPLRDEHGAIAGAVNVFRDVTANRRALHDLYNAEQHFKLLVQGTVDYAIFMLDPDGYIVSWNPGAQRILGYEQAEVIGRHVSIFYTPEDVKKGEPQRKLQQTVADGRAEEDSWRVRKDGERFWSTGVLDALHEDSGKIRGFVMIMRDNTERRLAEESTYFLANHDPLTGLANRTRFLERLHEALMNADRDRSHVALLLLDLDRFKQINDTLGHHVGDMLLKKVANRLVKCVRETDTVARLGGDEFVIILTRLKDVAGIEALAKKIVQEMARPYRVNRQDIRSGTSLGIAIYRKDGNDPGQLLQRADLAMYRAKASGRNHYRLFTPSMLTDVQTRKQQEDNLRQALQNGEFELSYQPQIDLDSLRLTGAEVLLRSKNRILQTMRTSHLIALAEETGLIVALGEWILRTACTQIRQWQKMGLPTFKVAVNFSASHLLHPGFLDMVRKVLQESGLEARYLELEVTEALLVAAGEAKSEVMQALKDIGVSISVDDFGTGYAALSYLKKCPVDVLKLDGSLIRNLPQDHDDAAIVSAIIKLAADLGIKVVAEGVETVDQMAHLKASHCDLAQGFFFSPPIRPENFEVLLQESRQWGPVLH